MANNVIVKDGNGANGYFKTTDNAGIHTPHNNIDSLPGTVESDIGNINTQTATLATAVSGSEMQVDIASSLPTGSNTIGKIIQAGQGKTPKYFSVNTAGAHVMETTSGYVNYLAMTAAADVTVRLKAYSGILYGPRAVLKKGVPYITPYCVDGPGGFYSTGFEIILSDDVLVTGIYLF